MTKTVKQIVDEYLEKQNEPNRTFDYIIVTKMDGANSLETKTYHNVSDLGSSIFPDIELHGINLHKLNFTHVDETGINRVQVIGKIIEFSEKIKEGE